MLHTLQLRNGFLFFSRTLFLGIMVSILLGNIFYSLYIFDGWYVTYNSTEIGLFIVACVLSVLIVVSYRKLNLKVIMYKRLILFIFIMTLLFRLVLSYSFSVSPAGDSWNLFDSVLKLSQNNLEGYHIGSYIGIHTRQLGGATFLLPFVMLFKENFLLYPFANAIILQLTFLFFVLFIQRSTNDKNAFYFSLLFSMFIPNYFYQFMIYSESFGLLGLSLLLFLTTLKRFKSFGIQSVFLLILSFSVMLRENMIIFVIAYAIVVLIYQKTTYKWLYIILLLCISLFSNKILMSIYNQSLDLELGNNALPFSTNIAIGLDGTGYTNEYLFFFSASGNNTKETHAYIMSKIKGHLMDFQNVPYFLNFVKEKFLYSWTDQDFDSLNYIMPFNPTLSIEDLKRDNSIRVGRAGGGSHPTTAFGELIYRYVFRIRDFEKIIYFVFILISIYLELINFKKFTKEQILLELFVIGTTLSFIIVETQPRYLLFSINVIIIHAIYSLWNLRAHLIS